MLVAKDLMCKTDKIISEDMNITETAQLLRDMRIGGLPVRNKKGKICGMVTVTDVFNAMRIVRRMHHNKPSWLSFFKTQKEPITIQEIYFRELNSVEPESPVEKVVEIMLEKNTHTVPVMNKEQTELYGVVGRHDVTWAIFGHQQAKQA